jgi:hypothetical protein
MITQEDTRVKWRSTQVPHQIQPQGQPNHRVHWIRLARCYAARLRAGDAHCSVGARVARTYPMGITPPCPQRPPAELERSGDWCPITVILISWIGPHGRDLFIT